MLRTIQTTECSIRLVVHLAECGMLARTPVNVDSLSCHSVASRIRRRRSHMVEGCDVLDVLDEESFWYGGTSFKSRSATLNSPRSNGGSEA